MSLKNPPDDAIYQLRSQIQKLQQDLNQKQIDLQMYKNEVQHLNTQLKTLIKNIESQLSMATQMQKYLIPTEILQIPGFDFSTKYIAGLIQGGDYFDIFKLKDKYRFAVIAASSSGHAMAALFLSVLIQMSSQIEAKKGHSPSKILHSLSKKLSSTAQSGQSSDVFLLIINRRNLEMTYCNAGEIKVWFQPYDTKNEAPQFLIPTSTSLGPVDQTEIKEAKIFLNAKDRLVIATPGLIATMKNQGHSIENLLIKMRTKGAHDLRNEIMYQAQKQGVQRDMTALVIDVKDHVLKLTSVT